MITVTITDIHLQTEVAYRVRSADPAEAIARAVRRGYGAEASLFPDSGLNQGLPATTRYGQIVKPERGNPGGFNCITGRVRVEVY